ALAVLAADAAARQPASSLSDRDLIRRAGRVPAKLLLAPKRPIPKPTVPLKGTIEDYVTAVVHTNGRGKIIRRSIVPCEANRSVKCVELVGDPCPPETKSNPEHVDCEGMALTVLIDVSQAAPRLDWAASGAKAVHD